MSYTPHIEMRCRIAEPGEITNGRVLQIGDAEDGCVDVLVDGEHGTVRLVVQLNQIWAHTIVDGTWRQRWTHDGRMDEPAQGLGLCLSLLERVPSHRLPTGHVAYGIEREGACVWLIDEDECTKELQDDVNDLYLRLAGDGLWIQVWLRKRPPLIPSPRRPLLAPTVPPLIMA